MAERVAAIDLGSNSTRLLVLDEGGRAMRRRMVVTRLGAGSGADGHLAPDAIDRTVEVLRDYATELDALGVARCRTVATAAARRAPNRDELFDRAETALGHRPELLDGEAEGALAFAGATTGQPASAGPFLVIDIGGGSTELIVGTDAPEAVRSLPLGCVRLTESSLHRDPPSAEELSNAIGEASDLLDDVGRELPAVLDAPTAIGVAGTITTVAAVELGLAAYDRDAVHGFRLGRAAVEDVFRTLATEPRTDRRHNPGLPADRVDTIVGGCCILVAVMRRLRLEEIVVSESDLLDAAAASLRVT
jgi:exopolyphosphatase/guanosine-5'-triphosphate,3'-diphosphate pyrophosphatase